MKKAIIYIVVLFSVAIVTISGTYAFFWSYTESSDKINADTHELKVLYSGDTEIDGYIPLVKTRDDGNFRREVNIALVEGSIDAEANIYIYLDEITSGFSSIHGLKWEIYELNGEEEKYINDGTFYGYSSGEKVYMAQGLKLSTTTREFAVYLWLNGYEAGNETVGAILRGYIGAETKPITGIME